MYKPCLRSNIWDGDELWWSSSSLWKNDFLFDINFRYEAEKKVLQEDFDKAKDTFDNLRDQLYKLTETAKSQREAGK